MGNSNIDPERCVHQLFEAQVIKTPEACAIVYHDNQLTYDELNQKANIVAYYLRKEGVTTDHLVAIYCERSIEMVIAVLGILKSGAAYLPLDHQYPEISLKFMFEDSGSDIVLSQKKLSRDIPFDAKKIINIDEILTQSYPKIAKETVELNHGVDHLGYVIYTSGSTGQSKGVMLPHKALSNLIHWHNRTLPGKRNVLQFTTINFDMSFIEIFSALLSGGTLVLVSEQERIDLFRLGQLIKHHHVQQLVISVPFLKSLAESKLDQEYLNHVKEIIIAGEQLLITPSILSFFERLSHCTLLNYYGPSETHVVTAYKFPEKVSEWPEYVPIGTPIDNTQIYILDDQKCQVPVGTVGEIFIGGVSLARGYINRSELTREKFITNPFSDSPESRLYRTGDFGKQLPDGQIVFLGRRDEQVKIRGFRVEPKEIELHLATYPGIREAVVIAKKSIFMDKHLEAFIVIDGEVNDHFVHDIYAFLQNRLPPHMLPSRFNLIDHMPLTNSGKINRHELETVDSSVTYIIHTMVEPNTETEKKLIHILEALFKVQVGIDHCFISLGGNSLLAIQVATQLRNEFGIDIPAYSILSDPTISDTAKRIDLHTPIPKFIES